MTIYQDYLQLEEKIKNQDLTVDEKLRECFDFIRSQSPFNPLNLEYVSKTYELSGNIFYENNQYVEALICYKEQQEAILKKISSNNPAYVSSKFILANAHYNIGKTLLKQDKIDDAKSNFITSWKLNDEVVSRRDKKNETVTNYKSRLDIFGSLIDIANKQNDYKTLIELSTEYAKKLKIPGVCLPKGSSIRDLEYIHFYPILYKCILAISVFEFLSGFNLEDDKKDEALENYNFILEKINEFDLFNYRLKNAHDTDELKNLTLDAQIVTNICKKGALICLEKGDNIKFKEYILKGLEYYEKLNNPDLQKKYLEFFFNYIDKINSISPEISKQDLEITSKIHSHVLKSFKRGMDFHKTIQLFKSFDLAEPSLDDPKLYKIFVDRQHHISQVYKENFGENIEYNDLVRSEFTNLLKFGNSILLGKYRDNGDFSNKDKLEIFNRIVAKANTLTPDFNEYIYKFERSSIVITRVVAQEETFNSRQSSFPSYYTISGSSYIIDKKSIMVARVEDEGFLADSSAGKAGAGIAEASAGSGRVGGTGLNETFASKIAGASAGSGRVGGTGLNETFASNSRSLKLESLVTLADVLLSEQSSLSLQSLKPTSPRTSSAKPESLIDLAEVALSEQSSLSSPSLKPTRPRTLSMEPEPKKSRN